MKDILRSMWQYRHFILSSIHRELVGNFVRSKLGGLWMIINPLAQVAIYALILSNILAAKLPHISNKYAYAIYLMAGTLGWSVFNETIMRCVNLFVSKGNLMQKINFPRITLPCITVGSAILNNFFLLIALFGIFLLLGHYFTFEVFWLIPLTAVVVALAIGIGLILGVLNVFVRDIGQVVPIILQVGFWFTPIVYPETVIPVKYRHILDLNPMYSIISAYHRILVYGERPHLWGILCVAIFSVLLLGVSLFLFRRASAEMVDVL